VDTVVFSSGHAAISKKGLFPYEGTDSNVTSRVPIWRTTVRCIDLWTRRCSIGRIEMSEQQDRMKKQTDGKEEGAKRSKPIQQTAGVIPVELFPYVLSPERLAKLKRYAAMYIAKHGFKDKSEQDAPVPESEGM